MKTNLGLVEYCKKQLDVDTIYVLGTCGWDFTSALLEQKCNQLAWNQQNRAFLEKYVDQGKKAFDCCGLIKAYLWDEGYDGKTDENEQMMYDRANEKGLISTIPEIPGVLVFMDGHVGVYVGNGMVVESTPSNVSGWGVQIHPLVGRGWTKWAKYKHIKYEEEKMADQIVEVGSIISIPGVHRVDEIILPNSKYPYGAVGSYGLCYGAPCGADDYIPADILLECSKEGANKDANGVLKVGEYFCCDKTFTVKGIEIPKMHCKNGVVILSASGVTFRMDAGKTYEVKD